MRLEFQKITIRNFKEYRGKHVLDISSLGLGVHYIRGDNRVDPLGSNGAGKSTLWDAFAWAIAGRTTRGLRGTDVRTWGGDAHASASVAFWIDDAGHVIKRSTETNGLWLDGKLTSQDEIDRLLGLNAINLPHTLILGQKRELFFDLRPSDKLQILSETLQLDRWEMRSKKAKDQAHELDKKMIELIATIAQLDRDHDAALERLDDLKRKSRAWEDERSQGVERRQQEISRLTKARSKLELAMGNHDLTYERAETELRALRQDTIKKQEELQPIIDRCAKYKAERDQTEQRFVHLEDIKTICPTCGQKIRDAEQAKEHADKERKILVAALDITNARYSKWLKRKNELNLVLERMRNAEKSFALMSDEAKDKYDQHKARIAEIDQQIAVLKARDRSDETNPFEETIRELRSGIKHARSMINEYKEANDVLSRRIVRTKYWVEGFRQVRLYLLQETLEELQEVTQNLLPDVGLDGWSVEYDIERETKQGNISTGLIVRILKPGMNRAVRWEAWSGGENQRLLIVGALALSEVLLRHAGIECDMIVLDEPTRHMSKEGVTDLVEHLIAMGADRSVFYCDHTVIENNRFANVVTITKDAKGSRIDVNA